MCPVLWVHWASSHSSSAPNSRQSLSDLLGQNFTSSPNSGQIIFSLPEKSVLILGLRLLEIKVRKRCGLFLLSSHISILRQWIQTWPPTWMGESECEMQGNKSFKDQFSQLFQTQFLRYSQTERVQGSFNYPLLELVYLPLIFPGFCCFCSCPPRRDLCLPSCSVLWPKGKGGCIYGYSEVDCKYLSLMFRCTNKNISRIPWLSGG